MTNPDARTATLWRSGLTVVGRPLIFSVWPALVAHRAKDVVLTVKGDNLRDGVHANFSGRGVDVTSVDHICESLLHLTISVAASASGVRSLTLWNADGTNVIYRGALTIT